MSFKLVTPGVLIATISQTMPPLQYMDERSNMIGARLSLPVKYVGSEFVTMIPELKSGRYDMIDTIT